MPAPRRALAERLRELASGPPLDAAIIGGGINGCAIAAQAAWSGLRTALFEASDFGFGTTWRSTKLIHGGLRYLEHRDFRLVFESLRERAWLLKTRPHLVRPQRFVLPVLPWTRRPNWQLGAGLWMYDLLSYERALPAHGRLSRRLVGELVPFVSREQRGGYSFYDARALAPERLALELALQAERQGAFIANHARVTGIEVDSGSVRGLEVQAGDETVRIPAKAVINAAGPWVDAVNRVAEVRTGELLGVTRGTHIAVEAGRQLPREAILSTARSDGRVLFAVPQDGLLLFGTTDLRYDGDPGSIRPTRAEVDYLIGEARYLLPGLDITLAQVRYAYAGLRPLQRVEGGPEAAITRRHEIIDHGAADGARGLYSVVGGKLSTFRPLAREMAKQLGAEATPDLDDDRPATDWRGMLLSSPLPKPARRHLRQYGPELPAVLSMGRELLGRSDTYLAGEVLFTAAQEHATTLSDILMRRTGIAWNGYRGLECHREAAELAATVLGWDKGEVKRQVAAFEADVAYHLPVADSLPAESNEPCTSASTSKK